MTPNISLLRHFIGGDAHATRHTHTGPLIDFLIEKFPNGAPTRIWLNGTELLVSEFDKEIGPDDDAVVVAEIPNDPITVGTFLLGTAASTTATFIVGSIAVAAFQVVVGMLLSALFPGPKARRAPNKVYDVAGAQNGLALGAPIPEHFGQIWFSPTVASQPYSYFAKDSSQWLNQILLVGEGDYRIDETRVGSSKLENLGKGLIDVHYIPPSVHGGKLGYILSQYGIWEDVVSNPEVQGIDFASDGNSVFFGRAYSDTNVYKSAELVEGFAVGDKVYVLGKQSQAMTGWRNHGTVTTVAAILNGQNLRLAAKVQGDSGNPTYQIIRGEPDDRWRGWFEVCPQHKTTSRIELDIAFPSGIYRTDKDGDFVANDVTIIIEIQAIDTAGLPTGAIATHTRNYRGKSNNPKRITERFDVASGRYRVRAKRADADDSKSSEVSPVSWTGLKAFCDYTPGAAAYGNVTLMVVKYRGSAALSGESASRITVKATRILGGVPTINPAEAFRYIAGSNADNANLDTLKTKWANTKGFNYRFDDETTVFGALEVVAASHRAVVQANGQVIGMRLDRAQTVDKALFTKQSILEDSFSTVLSLGPERTNDGIRGEIQAADGMHSQFYVWPASASRPKDSKLLGITDPDTALKHVKYLWAKVDTTRRVVNFDTEYDALISRVGDRVAVLHEMTEWMTSARVVAMAGTTLTLDREPAIQGAVKVRIRDEFGVPTAPVDATVAGFKLTLAAASPVTVYNHLAGQEGTTVAIGADASLRRSYLIQEIQPTESTVGVSAISYTDAPYDPSFAIPGEA